MKNYSAGLVHLNKPAECPESLEQQFERQLHDPRRVRIRDKSERRTIDVPIWRLELRMIECVEQFSPELRV